METLAILGHSTRGSEVIELLEMLGGKNRFELDGRLIKQKIGVSYYTVIDRIITFMMVGRGFAPGLKLYSLEEFEEKFPYKIGDRVIVNNNVEIINRMRWDDNEIKYGFFTNNKLGELSVKDLQPYKEQETMEDDNILNQLIYYFNNTPREVVEKEWHEYDKYNKIGITVKDYLKYIDLITKPKYPKTYEECCKVLEINPALELKKQVIVGWNIKLLCNLQQLLICRDAYWKIAGDWKPTWNTPEEQYCIVNVDNKVVFYPATTLNKVLTFPTEEMRDAFYENYKNLIESCKELL